MSDFGTGLLVLVIVSLVAIWVAAIYQHVMLYVERRRRAAERALWVAEDG